VHVTAAEALLLLAPLVAAGVRGVLTPADPPDGRSMAVRTLKKSSDADDMNRVLAMEQLTELV
jgi:hypothetical protein